MLCIPLCDRLQSATSIRFNAYKSDCMENIQSRLVQQAENMCLVLLQQSSGSVIILRVQYGTDLWAFVFTNYWISSSIFSFGFTNIPTNRNVAPEQFSLCRIHKWLFAASKVTRRAMPHWCQACCQFLKSASIWKCWLCNNNFTLSSIMKFVEAHPWATTDASRGAR